jgi:hypothetical protein
MRDNPALPAVKSVRAHEAVSGLQKTVPGAGGRGRAAKAGTNDENVDSTRTSRPNRRSSRLNVPVPDQTATAPKAKQRGHKHQHHSSPALNDIDSGAIADDDGVERGRLTAFARSKGAAIMNAPGHSRGARTCSPTPVGRSAQLELHGLDEIQDLRRQLQEEKGEPLYQPSTRICGLTLYQTRTDFCVALPLHRPHRLQRQFQSPKVRLGQPDSVS